MGGLRGEQKWRQDRTVPLRGGWDGGGVPTPGGTLGGSDQGGVHLAFPLPSWPRKPAQLSGQVLCPQRPAPGCVGPGGRRREGGGEQERQVGGTFQDLRSRRGEEGICPAHSGQTRGTPRPLLFC